MFEFVIFHATPPAFSIAGTAIIMSSGIYITVRHTPSWILGHTTTHSYVVDKEEGRSRQTCHRTCSLMAYDLSVTGLEGSSL